MAEARVLITLDVDLANPIRFPPLATAGIAVLRLRGQAGRDDLDALVERCIQAPQAGIEPAMHG